MESKLIELLKAAKSKEDAIENIHIELQNIKIQLVNKGYRVITHPGGIGSEFEEEVDKNQTIKPEDKQLVEYYDTVRALRKLTYKSEFNQFNKTYGSIPQEIIYILESKQ